jgi:tungstate transport system ATP-binding protein
MRAMPADLPIRFEDVTVRAGQGAGQVTALDRVSLLVRPGAPTVLIGPNGSGKTTLLRVAMGLAPPSVGRVTWDGVEDVPPIRRAIVFQRPVMLRRSAAANIRYAMKAAHIASDRHDARLAELLSLVGLDGMASRPARRLSGGEQQRLALARALARDPSALFLDEPTASLDPAATKAVEDIIRSIAASGIKIVMATHDLGQVRRLAEDVVLLVRGQVVEHAPAEQFFTAPARPETAAFLRGDLVL